MAQMHECCICEEELASKHIVTCFKCNTKTCKTCIKQSIEANGTEAKCVNPECEITWTREFLTENLGTSYVNGKYKKIMDTLNVEKVMATNPQFVQDAKYYKQMKEKKSELDTIKKEEKNIKKEKTQLLNNFKDKLYESRTKQDIDEFNTTFNRLIRKGTKISHERKRINNAYEEARALFMGYKSKRDAPIFQQPCPQPECKGFLSQKGVCGICNVHICLKCNACKGIEQEDIEKHVCKQEDIDSVNAIKKETKPCPRCGTRIHKINGCDQMWCPHCQNKYGEGTTFSWKTGKRLRERIHNPHYIEYLRTTQRNIREVGDVHCGGLPGFGDLRYRLGSIEGTPERAMMDQILQIALEISQYIVNPLRETLRNQNIHRMNQIKHIVGEINDVQFRRAVSKKEKQRQKDQEVLDIYEVILTVLTEKLNNFCNSIPLYYKPKWNLLRCSKINRALLETNDLLKFVEKFIIMENICLAKVGYIYKQKVRRIGKNEQQRLVINKFKAFSKKEFEKYKNIMENRIERRSQIETR